MQPQNISREYERLQPLYEKLNAEVCYVLETALKNANIKVHGILGRVKSIESFIGKMQRKEYSDPFSQIRDISGVRLICLFLSQLKDIGTVIHDNFEVLDTDNKLDTTLANQMGYLSVHYIVRLPVKFLGPRYDDIRSLVCELQVRTISMDAWANVSHVLAYKDAVDVPKDLRRDFFALSGLFYVADTHFEMFFNVAEQARLELTTQAASKATFLNAELNLDTLHAFLHSYYPERRHVDRERYTTLLRELVTAGYQTVGQLQSSLDKGKEFFLEEEELHPPHDAKDFADIGAVRGTLEAVDERFRPNAEWADKRRARYVEFLSRDQKV